MHRLYMRFMCVEWHKSKFYPVQASDDFKMFFYCDVIDTWATRRQLWSHNDRLFSRDCYGRFIITLALGQWFKGFERYTSVPSFLSFIIQRICVSVNCLASDITFNWWRATRTTWMNALIILQWRDSMRTMCGISTEPIRNLSIWFVERRNYAN